MSEEEFRKGLRKFCKLKNFTNKQTAEYFGVSRNTIFNWTHGIAFPNSANYDAIIKKLQEAGIEVEVEPATSIDCSGLTEEQIKELKDIAKAFRVFNNIED